MYYQVKYELFSGVRYGRSDFAGWNLDETQVTLACKVLNGEPVSESFKVHLTGNAVKELTKLNVSFTSEPQKMFENGHATVPDMFTVKVNI